MPEGDIDVELKEVDMESVQYHHKATIMVFNSRGQQPMKVGAVLDSGSTVSCASEKLAAKLGAYFDGIRVVHPSRKSPRDRVADGREVPIQEQTRFVSVTVRTPWAPR